jgi:hypothetical protein
MPVADALEHRQAYSKIWRRALCGLAANLRVALAETSDILAILPDLISSIQRIV